MIKVLKASAGSGKTYALAQEYIRLLLVSDAPDAYRHVLAVTFTNKATDEMKRRILKELHILATDPAHSNYLEYLQKTLKQGTEQISARAKQQLGAILNDYSSFAVSTIDRFFQQALRAFSREIGQFASYQVQLDRDALVKEGVDRVLDSLTEEKDTRLLDWLSASVRERLESGGSLDLEGRLTALGKGLRQMPEGEDLPRESLSQIRDLCRRVRKGFQERVQTAAQACLQVMEARGVDPAESSNHFLSDLEGYAKPQEEIKLPGVRFRNCASDPQKWFSKQNSHLQAVLTGALEAPLQAFLDCFGQPYKEYVTAGIILNQLYALGVAGELREAFMAIQKENNLLSLDDSNIILKGIIDGSDAPFVYEKLGVRFDDFLLDEFQDTADIQWENFHPLLENSVSEGKDSLVVGDVKQSIYRFRGSDWDLLSRRLPESFRDVRVDVLSGNWRTCRQIVAFNNAFFAYAAGALDRLLGTREISRLYEDVQQTPCLRETAPGSVEVCFTEDQLSEVRSTVEDLHAHAGAHWGDIAVLVRENKQGAAVAAELLKYRIPVVSDDSLFVKSSITVRRLVSQLELVDAPPDQTDEGVAGYLARSLGVRIPDEYHSLPDLCEGILRDLRPADPEAFDAEIPYIQSFMDYVQDWVQTGGNNLDAFLRAWKDASPKIASPSRGDSVCVMTIHKSKGLEFPFVIVPFAEEVELYKADDRWCTPDLKGSALENKAEGSYHVNLSGGTLNSFFEAPYLREQFLQAIDNLNIFYVALTRARFGLKVISKPLPKIFKEPKNMGQLLYTYVNTEHYTQGEPYDFSRLNRPRDDAETLEAGYASYPASGSGNRLRFSPEAADYFGEDGHVGADASRRIRGSVLHGILAAVRVPEDLGKAVDAAVAAGELPAAERAATEAFLGERLRDVAERGWFAPEVRVLSEAAVIGPDGGEWRPDRVVLHPDGRVEVVDYKFGEPKPSYNRQVQRYMDLYRRMGYKNVAGFLWYLEDNLVIFVN